MSDTSSRWLAKDGLALFTREWHTNGSPRGVIVLVHGLGEHSGRYVRVAEALTNSGYAFMTFDLRGHGESEGQRGHVSSYELLMDDIEEIVTRAQKNFQGLPLFLYGHSLGGNLVLNFVLRRSVKLSGVIVTSPWLRLAFEPSKMKVKLASIMNHICPAFSQQSGLETAALTHDEKIVKAYDSDPLVHSRISARLFLSVYAAGYWAIENASRFPHPLLLMHGSADSITSWEASAEFAKHVPKDCTFKLWDNLYHEIHHEPEWKEVLRVIIEWINNL